MLKKINFFDTRPTIPGAGSPISPGFTSPKKGFERFWGPTFPKSYKTQSYETIIYARAWYQKTCELMVNGMLPEDDGAVAVALSRACFWACRAGRGTS